MNKWQVKMYIVESTRFYANGMVLFCWHVYMLWNINALCTGKYICRMAYETQGHAYGIVSIRIFLDISRNRLIRIFLVISKQI